MKANEVDLCFVCDCTTSMGPSIKQVRDNITELVHNVSLKLSASLRVAFVAYRDWSNEFSKDKEDRIQILDFTNDEKQFLDFLSNIKADGGGGDLCEDVLGGLQAASASLSWNTNANCTKVLFHICDDPPHGTLYHTFFDEIEEERKTLTEFITYDCDTLQGIFRNEHEHLYEYIFKYNEIAKRKSQIDWYISEIRQKPIDRFPEKHANDPNHEDILKNIKKQNIQYFIAKYKSSVDQMIALFNSFGHEIGLNVLTMELTDAQQLFENVYKSISTAIIVSNSDKHMSTHISEAMRLFRDETSLKKTKHLFKVHCGIDFGTDGTAFAYRIDGKDQVYINEWKDSNVVDVKLKTNILLDSDNPFECYKFGLEASNFYMNMADEDDSDDNDENDDDFKQTKPKKNYLYFERFKMALYENNGNNNGRNNGKKDKKDICSMLKAVDGQEIDSKTILIAALSYIKDNILHELNVKRGLNVNCTDISFVLTVPAIWSIRSKDIMYYCAKRAGLVNDNILNHLTIAYEPDCASISIQNELNLKIAQEMEMKKEMAERKSKNKEHHKQPSAFGMPNQERKQDDTKDNNNKEQVSRMKRGEKYILCDLGGGTADICSHEILSLYNVRELYKPSGGAYGSTYIDLEFVNLLKLVIPREWILEYQKSYSKEYVQLIGNFKNAKRSFFQNVNSKRVNNYHNVNLPFNFIEFMNDKIDLKNDPKIMEFSDLFEGFETELNHQVKIEKFDLVLTENFLKISMRIWRYLFDIVVDPIVLLIEKLITKLDNDKHQSFTYLLLCGGFCESRYVQKKLTDSFGLHSKYEMKIIIPKRPILSVVEGSALYTKNSGSYVKSRRIPKSIGIEIRKELSQNDSDLDLFKNEKIIYDSNLNKYFLDKVYHKFVNCGDEIKIDDPPILQYFEPFDKESNEIEIKLYEFDDDGDHDEKKQSNVRIMFVDDPKCNLLATKSIKLPNEWLNKNNGSRQIPVAFFFADTQLKVYIAIPGINQKDAHIRLDYQYS